MNHTNKNRPFAGLEAFLPLWATQGLSALGSSMTSFALIVWSYQQEGSALVTALLSICSYAPYVLLSLFAGALSDRWDRKRTMLVCDAMAALTTVAVFFLLSAGKLEVTHLYVINAVNGLMNCVQQPASEVAISLLAPKEQYQRVGGLRSLSGSLVTLLSPAAATALLSFAGMGAVIAFDLLTFCTAFITLAWFIRIPDAPRDSGEKTPLLRSARECVGYLRQNRGILDLMFFLAAINLVASAYQAALPALIISRRGAAALGVVETCVGVANLAGSLLASLIPAPRSRVRVICGCLFFAMSTENLLLSLGRSLPVWCFGAVLGWLLIPVMNTNLDALMRGSIPLPLQGRVFAARNTFQFFTIPIGYLLGGALVDWLFEPLMAAQGPDSLPVLLFGAGPGSGAAALFAVLAASGVLVCLIFSRDRHIWALEKPI